MIVGYTRGARALLESDRARMIEQVSNLCFDLWTRTLLQLLSESSVGPIAGFSAFDSR